MDFDHAFTDCFTPAVSAIPGPLTSALLGGIVGLVVTRHLLARQPAPLLRIGKRQEGSTRGPRPAR